MNIAFFITIVSTVYVLFIPGFFLSFIFFKPKSIDSIERLLLSFALSLTIVPLITFYCNLFGIPITPAAIMFEVIGILFITGIILVILYRKHFL